jgi:N-acetylmuramoyl-L-alanine amidase
LKAKFSQRSLRWAAMLWLATLPCVPAYARTHHAASHHGEAWARDHFTAAERMREALNGRPSPDRSRRDYQRVINAYRSVYYGAPTSSKADPSVVAVAETMVEMGRRFDDNKILNAAIAQYKFLRREYPGSKYRCDALFTIGEIYNDDLNEPEQARSTFREFLQRYPHNRLVEDAQQAIADIDKQVETEKKTASDSSGKEREKEKKTEATDLNPAANSSQEQETAAATPIPRNSEPTRPTGRLPRVTGIRHWSTPDYTRVAIDLESDIKFGSQRIDNPDRIFFDLRDTKLASTLVGKSFDVDDGFLKKIRVAQFQPGRTRVVLEVDNLSDYDAFLLPDPYRLIIDIHGRDSARKSRTRTSKAATENAETAPTKEESRPGNKSGTGEELRAQAGKAPVNRQDVGDGIKITPKGVATSSKSSPGTRDAHAMASVKSEVPAVTKTVVDADDDDDDTPVKAAAKLDPEDELPGSGVSAPHTAKSSNADSELLADEKPNKKLGSRMASSRARGKSSSRLNTKDDDSPDADIREASPTASGDRSLIRALGLKIGKIVIDPGHGGHDTGTIGPNGLEEKDLVLEVGRKLGKLLETRLGAEVVYTRKNDTFIPLETRTAIANQQRADLFISIHANSSHDPAARGVETYYLNFTSSPEALEVAARENAVSEKSIYELQDLVKKIALKEKIEESREFAGDVQQSLHSGLVAKSPGIRDRGVKKAPFIVLIGANMPSILAEISFVSNPGDERRLETSEYRQRIAESLYRGIAKYVNGLSGVKVASKMDRTAGQ